jgi:hypothetical protein
MWKGLRHCPVDLLSSLTSAEHEHSHSPGVQVKGLEPLPPVSIQDLPADRIPCHHHVPSKIRTALAEAHRHRVRNPRQDPIGQARREVLLVDQKRNPPEDSRHGHGSCRVATDADDNARSVLSKEPKGTGQCLGEQSKGSAPQERQPPPVLGPCRPSEPRCLVP